MILQVRAPRALTWLGVLALVCLGALLPLTPGWAQRATEPAALPPPAHVKDPDRPAGKSVKELLREFETLYKEGKYAEAAWVAGQAHAIEPDNAVASASLELVRAQLKAREVTRPAPPPVQAAPDDALQRAEDEVELLEAQLRAKKAVAEAAKVAHAEAMERVELVKAAGPATTRAALLEAMKEADLQAAEVRVREAELLEPEVRLKQAKRRLAALQARVPRPPAVEPPARPEGRWPAPAEDADRKRLRELEKKLDQLLKELELLRRDLPRKHSGLTDQSDVLFTNKRDFMLPIAVKADQATKLARLLLLVSADEGHSWRQEAEVTPTERAFPVKVAADGLYWFTLCTVDQNGVREPRSFEGLPALHKVRVDTVKPVVTLEARRYEDRVEITWAIKDENPGSRPLKLKYMLREDPTRIWIVPLGEEGKQAQTGKVSFTPEHPGTLLLHLVAEDRAGNLGEAKTELPAAKP